ncbi:hypothetical protein LOZ66_006926 [Ophidiomyces ophidiicola]|nr:hypothetical protein LOZ66_006926 [Ophidiomyces ophidiicola]
MRCFSTTFSTSQRPQGYEATLENLKIGSHTKVLFQGFTGKQATVNVKESLEWGTKIVGGVKPGVEGEHLGLPIFPSVRAANENVKPDATAIYVPGNQTAAAIEEAIEAEISLVVAVAEHVPIHDILRIHAILKTQSKTRLVGANCPGIISAIGKCRIGFQPLSCFSPGHVGIIAKSGTLSYEAVASTTRAGLGQSLCIGMGGDMLAGTNFVDALGVFEHDDDTHAIIIIGEVGGTAELDAAEWIKDYRRRTANPKPIMALVGGLEAPAGEIMGHAGACAGPGEPAAQTKLKALQDAGAVIVDHPEKFGQGMKALLNNPQRPAFEAVTRMPITQQRRSYPIRSQIHCHCQESRYRRGLHLSRPRSLYLLKENNIHVSDSLGSGTFFLGVTIDRETCSPCIIASPTSEPATYIEFAKWFPFDYGKMKISLEDISCISKHLGLHETAQKSLFEILQALVNIFMIQKAFLLETRVTVTTCGNLEVQDACFSFDHATYNNTNKREDPHIFKNKDLETPEEAEAEKSGMVYVTLKGEGSIGTLVNGAGLAMNTVDALTVRGGHCANFLDTGGKATAKMVKSAFQILLCDPRVKAIFVNIFGGLTRSEMIAEGIITAFRDLSVTLPVVVRLRGTNEGLGQKMIADSKLPLFIFDSFEEAAAKVISLAQSREK